MPPKIGHSDGKMAKDCRIRPLKLPHLNLIDMTGDGNFTSLFKARQHDANQRLPDIQRQLP
jgi:hypothetical protein